MINTLLDVFENMANAFLAAVNTIIKAYNAIPLLPNAPTLPASVNLPTIGQPAPKRAVQTPGGIRMMAEGGIVNSATLAIIGERGPEAVIPLDRMKNGGGQNITVNITGGISTSADIGRAVVNAIKAMNRVDGPAQIQVA